MKQSLYNNFIPLKTGGVLGYNSLKRRFAVFTNDPKTLLKESEASNNSSSQEYIRLKEGGFIIDDTFDEYQQLLVEINATDFNTEAAELHINPTLDCNFRCWYCYEEHMAGSKMSEEVLEAVKNYLNKTITQPLRHFRLSFSEGNRC